jgi:hypothetical protein
MVVENIFDSVFYPAFKEYVEAHNNYSAKVVKINPEDSKVFPIIPVRLLSVSNRYNNLNYGEETYSFGIEIDIYAVDTTVEEVVTENSQSTVIHKKVSKKMVCDNLCEIIVDYIKETYHFTVRVNHDAPNMDTNVHRTLIRLTGVLDTKYGNDNLVIYPTLR